MTKSMLLWVGVCCGLVGCAADGGNDELGGESAQDDGPARADGLIEKGFVFDTVDERDADNIKLVYDNVPDWMQEKFRDAAWAWTAADSKLYVSEANNGPELLVVGIDGWDWRQGNSVCVGANNDTSGCAFTPQNGKPGTIYMPLDLNVVDNPGDCDWEDDVLRFVATHEMGHALGFAHPGERGSFQVADTCTVADGCPTIMQTTYNVTADCHTDFDTLQPDDIAAAITMYGPR